MIDFSKCDLQYIVNLYQLSDEALVRFVWQCHRSECNENPRVYMKAIRACLLALGFDSDFVEIHFRDVLEEEFKELDEFISPVRLPYRAD